MMMMMMLLMVMMITNQSSHVSGGRNGGDDHDDDDANNHAQNQQPQTQPSKSKGRRKIEIKRIESERRRLSTFSKRRSGIYKKANEIVTLCGAQVGVVGITPAGRTFAYGSPSAEAIIQRFLHPHHQIPTRQGLEGVVDGILEANRRARVEDLNSRYDELLDQLEMEKERFNRLVQIDRLFENQNPNNPHWLDIPDGCDIPDEQLDAAAEKLRDITSRVAELRRMRERPHIMMPPPPAGQPLQTAPAPAAVQEMMIADNPSSSADNVVAATNNNGADQEVDEEEMMLRFFGSYPSSPPGPF